MFKTMKYLIADYTVISQADQGQSLSRESFMPQPPECLSCL